MYEILIVDIHSQHEWAGEARTCAWQAGPKITFMFNSDSYPSFHDVLILIWPKLFWILSALHPVFDPVANSLMTTQLQGKIARYQNGHLNVGLQTSNNAQREREKEGKEESVTEIGEAEVASQAAFDKGRRPSTEGVRWEGSEAVDGSSHRQRFRIGRRGREWRRTRRKQHSVTQKDKPSIDLAPRASRRRQQSQMHRIRRQASRPIAMEALVQPRPSHRQRRPVLGLGFLMLLEFHGASSIPCSGVILSNSACIHLHLFD